MIEGIPGIDDVDGNVNGYSILRQSPAADTAAGLHVTVSAVRRPLRTDAISGQSLRPGQPVEPGAIVVLAVG